MNFQVKGFDFNINLEENINVLVIENKEFYREICNSLLNEKTIRDGKILISNDTELLIPDKYIFTFYDYYSWDINKYCISKIYKKINEYAQLEYDENTNIIKSKIENYIYDIIEPYQEFLEIEKEIDVLDILKSYGVRIKQFNQLCLDKIINYINIIYEIFGINIFFFINLKDNFTNEEILELYKYIMYNNIKIVLVQNIKTKALYNENIFIIDEDLCEIY